MTRLRGVATVACVAAWALAPPADAWVRTSDAETGVEVFWAAPVVPYDLSSEPSHPSPSCEAGAEGDPLEAAVRASFSAWEQGCSALRLVYGGRIAELRTGAGGTAENVVVVRRGWCSEDPVAKNDPCMTDPDVDCGGIYDCYEDHGDHSTVALTTVLYDPTTGRLFDADMELNGWGGQGAGTPLSVTLSNGAKDTPHGFYFTCEAPPGPACTTYGQTGCIGYDLQNTVTHEAGHFIGLAHPCSGQLACRADPPPGEVPYDERTMYPYAAVGETSKRQLSADDVAGVCAIYPAQGGCGCGAGGAPGALAAALAALALRSLTRRARPRTRRPGAGRR